MIRCGKPGSGIVTGKEFQNWMAVYLILEMWYSEDYRNNDEIWLRQEIGVKKYGIFDDIQVYVNGKYYFYQCKGSSSNIGDSITLDDLIDHGKKSGELSLIKMYNSFVKIRSILPKDKVFKLIVCHQHRLDPLIQSILESDGSIEDAFARGTVRLPEKIELRKKMDDCCSNPEDFAEFLSVLCFQDHSDIDRLIDIKLNHKTLVRDYLYNISKDNSLFEFDGKERKIYPKNLELFLRAVEKEQSIDSLEPFFPRCWFINDWLEYRKILPNKTKEIIYLKIKKVIETPFDKGPDITLINEENIIMKCFLIQPDTAPNRVSIIREYIIKCINEGTLENIRIIKNTSDDKHLNQFPEKIII